MQTMLARLPAEPVWEMKGGLALHQWLLAQQVDWIRRRIGEMRHPVPALDRSPDQQLDALLEETHRSNDTIELLAGVYGVTLEGLRQAYQEHLDTTNPLVDHPTRRILRFARQDLDDALAWARTALDNLIAGDRETAARAKAWQVHLRAWLDAAGGIGGSSRTGDASLPAARAAKPDQTDFHPGRDPRFEGQYNFEFPPHVVYNAPKRACRRAQPRPPLQAYPRDGCPGDDGVLSSSSAADQNRGSSTATTHGNCGTKCTSQR